MTSWLDANRLANLAAAQAHGDLGVDTTAPPIDVYDAIGEAGVILMWRPMPRQFGAYIAVPGSRPGILINNGLPFPAQRHTAGHELGHHRLGHGTRFDADLDAPARQAAWTPEERAAEAFAAWFLMPRKAVLTALARLGLDRPRTPPDVYRLSLLLGTPYLSTARHLPSLRLASQSLASSWARTPPARIKNGLDPAADAPRSRKPDVWLITESFTAAILTAHPGDRLVIEDAAADLACDHPRWLSELQVGPAGRLALHVGRRPHHGSGTGLVVLEIQGSAAGEQAEVTLTVSPNGKDSARQWAFGVRVEGGHSGIARRWIS
jgi:hypothetical protein